MNSHAGPRHAAAGDAADDFDDFDRPDDFDHPDAATDNNERGQVVGALLWVAWVIGLALLWYGIGYASTLAPENLAGAPQGNALPLPLYPLGYGRLAVGALVAGTVVGLFGRRANRVWPAGLLAAAAAWFMTRSRLEAYSQDRLYGDDRLVLLASVLLVVATVIGLGLGIWGARGRWQGLVAVSAVLAIAVGHVVAVITDLQSAISDQPSTIPGSEITRWLTLAALFGLAVAVAALGKAHWLVLPAIGSVVLPVAVTVLTYLGQLIRPGAGRDVNEQILAPISDLLSAVLSTWSTWWPPLAVFAGGVIGLLVWQARRSRRADMPVLDPAHPVTTGDPGGRTPRRGDPDD